MWLMIISAFYMGYCVKGMLIPKKLHKLQVQSVIDWMNTWEQLKDTVIPIRFKEDFLDGNPYDKPFEKNKK